MNGTGDDDVVRSEESGFTTEGGRYHMFLFHDRATGHLLRVIGSYSSRDGGGLISIERADDGLYESFDLTLDKEPFRHKDPRALLPWVVADGEPDVEEPLI